MGRNTIGTVLIDIKADTQQLISGFDRAENAVNKTTKKMSTAVKTFAAAYLSLNAIDMGKTFLRQADAMTNINSKLKLVTSSTNEFIIAQTELYKISQDTRSSFAGNIELYQRISMATKNLNLSQKDMLDLTKTINQSMTISGTTAAGSEALIVQLGQAFSSNFQSVAQELGTIRDQAPRLYQAILSGTKMTAAEFKKAAESGQLSSKMIIDALENQGIAVDKDFGKMVITVDGATTRINNAILKNIGNFDKLTGTSKFVADSISSIAKSMDEVNPEELLQSVEYIKNASIALVASYTILKTAKGAYAGYNAVLEYTNKVNKLNIDLENSKAQAYSDGMKALYARKIADKALNTGMLDGNILKTKQIKSLQNEAIQLEKVAKNTQAYSYQLEGTANSFKLASITGAAFKTVLSTIPFIAISIGISAIATSLFEASKNSELLEKTLHSTGEELKKLTKNQLEFRKQLLSEELTKQKAREFEAQYQLELGYDNKNKKLRIERQAKIDDEKAKTKDLINQLKEINNIEGNFNKSKNNTNQKVKTPIKKPDTESEILHQLKLEEIKSNINSTDKSNIELLKNHLQYTEDALSLADIMGFKESTLRNLQLERLNTIEEIKKEQDKNLDNLIKTQSAYTQIMGTGYDRWLETVNQKLIELSSTGILTAQELQNVYDTLENQYKTDNLITANEEYMSLLDSQISLSESALDWNANLEGVANTIQNIAKSSMQLSTIEKKSEKEKLKAQNEFYKLTKDISKDSEQYKTAEINLTKKTKAINEASIQSQIVGYGTLAGAVSQMFDEGSKDAAAFHVVESGLAMVAGIRAILTQGSGDPYTAFARMAAMAASVASLLSSANIAFGGDSVSSSSDAFSAQVENTGTGSVLGDTSKASESITNSLGILEDYARPEFQLLSSMNQSLLSIDEKIGGVSALLIQNGGYAFGEGYTEVSFDDKGLGITFQNQLDKIATAIDPVSNFLGGATDKLTGAILGGLFGKTSVKQKLTDYGINFNNALLTDAIEQINGQAYQTITTKIKKKSWFHSSTKTKVKTYFQGLDDEVERQFSLVLSNLYDTTIQAGEALDTSSTDIENSLSNFIVSIGKISTKGKSGEQLQEQISNIFSKIGDDIAQTAFPALTQFQSIGEGLFETLTRVASGMEVAEYYINRLGNGFEDINYKDIVNKQGDVGVEVLTQSITKLDEAVYGTNNGVVQMIENFSGTTEELYTLYTTFEDVRDMLSLVGKESKYLTSDMLLGAGGADELSGALEDYFKNFLNGEEQLTFYTQQMQKEFDNLNISMPSSIEGFKKLIEGIDISTAEGQELLGRIVLLSDDYKSLIDNTEELFYTQVQNALDLDKLSLELFDTAVSAVQKMSDKFTQLTQSVETTVNKLLSNSDGANAQEELIKSFWQKRASIDTLLAKDGNLTDSEASNLSSLISDINSLSTSIQSAQNGDNTDITNNLVNELQSLQDGLDLDNSILKVKVLDSGGNATDVASVGVITALAQALAGTNSNPLDISNFSNGGNLTAANEITFRTSFEAQSALTYADELAKLRTNLSYINLSTVDAGDFFTKLQSLDENAFGNMIEFFNSIGAIANNQVMVNGQLVDLPSYDVGTSYVPYDQVAKIHQGEMVLDKNFSDSLRRYGIPTGGGNISVDMSGVINELKETRLIIRDQANEIKRLRKMTENIESSYLSTNEQGA